MEDQTSSTNDIALNVTSHNTSKFGLDEVAFVYEHVKSEAEKRVELIEARLTILENEIKELKNEAKRETGGNNESSD